MLCLCLSVGCVVENKIILQSGEISATSIIIHIIIHMIIRGKPRSQIDASTRDIYASHRVASQFVMRIRKNRYVYCDMLFTILRNE